VHLNGTLEVLGGELGRQDRFLKFDLVDKICKGGAMCWLAVVFSGPWFMLGMMCGCVRCKIHSCHATAHRSVATSVVEGAKTTIAAPVSFSLLSVVFDFERWAVCS
jgi:hypothetical protein